MLRGATVYKARAKQGRDFTGLRHGNITPTDVDALIEYENKAYVFIEAKLSGVDMPYGQKLALERLCDDLQKIKPTLLVLITHNTPIEQEIDFAGAMVEKYRYKGRWAIPKNVPTAKQLIDSFLKEINP
jgi:hypothetical protein